MARSGVSLQLIGADALRDALQRIPAKVAKRVETTGCRKGAQELRRKLRARAPRGETGQLRKSIRYRRIKYRRNSGLVGFKVYAGGLHQTGRSFIWNAGLLRMFEYGDSAHPNFPQRRFWNAVVRGNRSRLVSTILGAMGDAVDLEAGKEFARQRRKAGRRR